MRLPDDAALRLAQDHQIEIARIERAAAKQQAKLARGNRQQRRAEKARARRRK